jgi:uncharacterized membrane protein YjfL (UPF0719 family)
MEYLLHHSMTIEDVVAYTAIALVISLLGFLALALIWDK